MSSHMDRWNALARKLGLDERPYLTAAGKAQAEITPELDRIMAEAVQIDHEAGEEPRTAKLVSSLEDLMFQYGAQVNELGYTDGYGDGFAAGALAMLRLLGVIPDPSEVMQLVLGLNRAQPLPKREAV